MHGEASELAGAGRAAVRGAGAGRGHDVARRVDEGEVRPGLAGAGVPLVEGRWRAVAGGLLGDEPTAAEQALDALGDADGDSLEIRDADREVIEPGQKR